MILHYQVAITTGDDEDSGTTSDVTLTLKGSEGQLDKYPLTKPTSGSTPFEKGQTDTFSVETVYLGQLTEATLEHNGTDIGS